MFLTYFIILILSILFRLMHWPGADILLLITPLFPLIDILVQIIRRKRNPESNLRVLASTALFGFAVFLIFRLLFWNGGFFVLFFFLATLIPFLIVFILRKPKIQKRFTTVFVVSILAIGLQFTPAYRIYEIYTTKNPFHAKDQRIPEFALFKLAWFYHLANKNQDAEATIQRAINQIRKECATNEYAEYYRNKEFCEDRRELLEKELLSLQFGLPMNYDVINELY